MPELRENELKPCTTRRCPERVTDVDHEGKCETCFFEFAEWDEDLYEDLFEEREPE